MKIINLTPHPVHILDQDNNVVKTFEKPEVPARLSVSISPIGSWDDVPFTKTVFGEPTGLPEETEGVFYIVSQLFKNALPFRTDLLVPAEVQYNEDRSQILGCRSLGV